MENCEKCAEMFPKKRKNAQILLKSQVSAQQCWKCKIVFRIRKSAFLGLSGTWKTDGAVNSQK